MRLRFVLLLALVCVGLAEETLPGVAAEHEALHKAKVAYVEAIAREMAKYKAVPEPQFGQDPRQSERDALEAVQRYNSRVDFTRRNPVTRMLTDGALRVETAEREAWMLVEARRQVEAKLPMLAQVKDPEPAKAAEPKAEHQPEAQPAKKDKPKMKAVLADGTVVEQ